VRSTRHVELTAAGRVLLEEGTLALAALERAVDRTRLAGTDTDGTIRLCYTPIASFGTLGAILTAVQTDNRNLTVIQRERYSATIPARLLAGEDDIGLVLYSEPTKGVASEILRVEPLAALLSEHHHLADTEAIPLAKLQDETLLIFSREHAPTYYDHIISTCERAGFQPRVNAFRDPRPLAMLARMATGHEVGLTPASFAFHAADAQPGVVARKIVDPEILAEWSIVWPMAAESAAIARFLDSARKYAADNNWPSWPKPEPPPGY